MYRLPSTTAILLLIIPLLLLPLQGHARTARADAVMPCAMDHAMDHQGMHAMAAMGAAAAVHPCDDGVPCSKTCQDCAACSHAVAGLVFSLQERPPVIAPAALVRQAGQRFTSVTLFKDHPPPRLV